MRAYREANPEYSRRKNLYQKYGLNIEKFDAMLAGQDGRCAICFEEFTQTPCIDHNHDTGAVRGLLCEDCNQGIGRLKDSIPRVKAALAYLIEYEGEE
jgi:hypothetical protein